MGAAHNKDENAKTGDFFDYTCCNQVSNIMHCVGPRSMGASPSFSLFSVHSVAVPTALISRVPCAAIQDIYTHTFHVVLRMYSGESVCFVIGTQFSNLCTAVDTYLIVCVYYVYMFSISNQRYHTHIFYVILFLNFVSARTNKRHHHHHL